MSGISILRETAVSNPPPLPQNSVASTLPLGRWHSETFRQMGHKKGFNMKKVKEGL
jgi:hypothetical protein